MHRTTPTSIAGKLRFGTSFGASASMTTETAILTISHNMKLTALLPGDMLESLLVMPRAIKAPGTTTAAAPYSTDHAISCLWVRTPASRADTTPTANITPNTRHGDTAGSWARNTDASAAVSGLNAWLPASSS